MLFHCSIYIYIYNLYEREVFYVRPICFNLIREIVNPNYFL